MSDSGGGRAEAELRIFEDGGEAGGPFCSLSPDFRNKGQKGS